MGQFRVTGEVLVFPGEGGWFYIRVPEAVSEAAAPLSPRPWTQISARLGDTRWPTSLMPLGDGTRFIAIKKAVRRAEEVIPGDVVTIEFTVRAED